MQKEDCFELGYLSKAHGLDGKVQAVFDVEDPMYYTGVDAIFVLENDMLVPYFVEKLSHTNANKFHLKFEDVDSKNDASSLSGSKLFLPLTMLPELSDEEQYLHDSLGFKVVDKVHGEIGEVEAYIESGPQMIMAVRFKEKEVLIPVHDEILLETNFETKTVLTKLPGGLLELYLED